MFVKESDKKGTYIIEGEAKPGNVFSVKRFICQVQEQETPAETQAIADHLVEILTKNPIK